VTRKALSVVAVAGVIVMAGACRRAEQLPSPETAAPISLEAPVASAPSEPAAAAGAPAGRLKGTVLETMDAGEYTYVRVKPDEGQELWAAGPQTKVAVGNVVYVETTMPMPDFESASLGRKFDVVYFCGSLPVVPSEGELRPLAMEQAHGQVAATPATDVDLTGIAKAEGGYTVAELYEKAATLKGQTAALRGRIVKFTPQVMNMNWVHVRDGSGDGATGDLTVTTQSTAAVGDLVIVRGTVVTGQDFGAGYSYAVLLKDATIEPQAP
jgi:hypothetical protein